MRSTTTALLFIDFDGVLHRGTSGTFRQLPLLEAWLRSQPHVGVVISSTWRWAHTLEELRDFFSPDVATQVIGVTPTLRTRELEILAWRQAAQLEALPFAVLDDEPALFSPGWPPLLAIDGRVAITDQDLHALTLRLGMLG